MTKNKLPHGLVYDIETTYLMARVWGLGKQVVRHTQLLKGFSTYDIMCIAYCWTDKPGIHLLTWDPKTHDSSKMIAKFDAIVKQADFIIGKNNRRFDDKHINTLRLLHNQTPMPDWTAVSDDLESQIRRYFYLPSYSLDYLTDMLFGSKKTKMEFNDWVEIIERGPNEKKCWKKMLGYCKRDVLLTFKAIKKIWPHVKPKFNRSAFGEGQVVCAQPFCGSTDIHKNGTRLRGKTKYQRFECATHGGFAGYRPVNAKPSTPLMH